MAGDLWDEYRVLIDDTQQVSARRQSADNVYLSANSLVLGAGAFFIAQGALRNAMMLAALLVLAVAGSVIVREWAKQDRIFIEYLRFRYDLLKQMESQGQFPVPIFHEEDAVYKNGGGSITHFGFSQSAARVLPRMFGILYASAILAIAGILAYVATTGNWAAWGIVLPH